MIVCCCILHNLVLGQNELDIVNLMHQLELQACSSYYYFKQVGIFSWFLLLYYSISILVV